MIVLGDVLCFNSANFSTPMVKTSQDDFLLDGFLAADPF